MSNKKLISYLTAMLMMISRGITPIKADTILPNISDDYISQDIKDNRAALLPIYSLLNMTKEQGQQKFKLRDFNLASFLFNDGSLITIPSLEISYNIIDDKDKNTEDNIINLKYGISILRSDFKKLINNDEIYDRFSNLDLAYLSLEPASKRVMIIEPLTSENHLNPDFFKRIFINNPELEVSKIKEYRFEEYLSKYLRIKDLKQVGINPEDFEEEITLEEFRDKYYLKFVKEIDLPIEHNSTYPNPSIPKLKQEFLDLDLSTQKEIVLAEVASGRDTEKILICRYESNKCYDFFTNEEIKFENNSSKLKSDGLDGQLTKGVFMILNIEFWKPRSIDLNIGIREGREYLYQLLGAAKQMKTIEDLIIAYQKIPLEYQIDYSYFDFTNSPNVEQPDKSSKVVDEKGNFVADLDNMTVRPKVKALNKES